MSGTFPLSSHTALSAVPAVALDLETTGLDPKRDRIVQVALIAMVGSKVLDEPRLDRLVDPGMPIPAASTRIHGITDADVAGAPGFADIVGELREQMAGRVVVGQHIAFDLAVLRREAERVAVPWHDPPCLDVGLLLGALDPSIHEPDLDIVTGVLGVKIERRHSAYGDAMAAADAFGRLIPRLRNVEVRTLGEAQVFAARRSDIVLRQARAGWHAAPGTPFPPSILLAPPRIDSYVFERLLQDVMSAPVVMVSGSVTLREAARLMIAHRIGALLVGTHGRPPDGIVTERDLMRATAMGTLDPDAALVDQVMTVPVETMDTGEMLYRALGRMDRKGIRHLCVVDAAGRATGMVSQRDLLRHRARSALTLGDAIAVAGDTPALAAAFANVPEVAARLVAEGVGGIETARVISSEIRALTARAANIAAARLGSERGEAPAPWCLLVLGSGGRGESLLAADQDNALIHAGRDSDDAWFAALGAMVADILDEAGLPRCMGGVMAANAQWRGNAEAWRKRVDGWLSRARLEDLLSADIFFDLVPVAGEFSLAYMLQDEAIAAGSGSRPFIALLAESVSSNTSPVGWFGRLRTVEGRIDLKRWGLLPLTGIARTLALRIGSNARATPERLHDAAAAGRISGGDTDFLVELHADLMTRVLRQQLEDLAGGIRPSSRVSVRSLGQDGSRRLSRGLRKLDEILRELRPAVAG